MGFKCSPITGLARAYFEMVSSMRSQFNGMTFSILIAVSRISLKKKRGDSGTV